MTTHTIEEMRAVAASRGGKCLSEAIQSMHDNLLWECQDGHRWLATPSNIIRKKSWCPIHARSLVGERLRKKEGKKPDKLSVRETRAWDVVVAERHGRLIRAEEKNRLQLQCSSGHVWSAPRRTVEHDVWCPVCADQQLVCDHNGIISSKLFTVVSETTWKGIEALVDRHKGSSVSEVIDLARRELLNDVAPVIKAILHSKDACRACMVQRPFTSIADLAPFSAVPAGSLEAELAASTAFAREFCSVVDSLTRSLIEPRGKWVGHVIAAIIKARFKVLDLDSITAAVNSRLSRDRLELVKVDKSYLLTKRMYEDVAETLGSIEPRSKATPGIITKKLYGISMKSVIKHCAGIGSQGLVAVGDASVKDLRPLMELGEEPGPLEIGEHLVYRAAFFKALLSKREFMREHFADIRGGGITGLIGRLFESIAPGVNPTTMYCYVDGKFVPYLYDDFSDADAADHAWILGALLTEGCIFKGKLDHVSRFVPGHGNPLVFFDKLIPQMAIPSGGSDLRLSPPLDEYLERVGAKRGDGGRAPVPLDNYDMFLAAMFDAGGFVEMKERAGKQKSFCLINIRCIVPAEHLSEWMRILPGQVPLVITGCMPVPEEITAGYAPTIYPVPEKLSSAQFCLFGRKIPLEVVATQAAAVEELARTLKYFYKHVFPHCVHPRLAALLDVGEYIEDEYGTAKNAQAYAIALRAAITSDGGLDYSGIKDTLCRPLIDPETGKVLIYKPAWMVNLMRRKGVSDADLLASVRRYGGFDPFPVSKYFRSTNKACSIDPVA